MHIDSVAHGLGASVQDKNRTAAHTFMDWRKLSVENIRVIENEVNKQLRTYQSNDFFLTVR